MNFWPYKIFVIFYITWERSANIGKNTSAGFIGIYCSTGESKQKKHLMTIICESFLLHLYTLAKQIKGTLDHHGITQSGTHHWYRSIQLGSISHSECVTPVSVANKNDNMCTGKKSNNKKPPKRNDFAGVGHKTGITVFVWGGTGRAT